MKSIQPKGIQVYTFVQAKSDFISLTDIARDKNRESRADIVKNWMRTRSTIEYLGSWEKINNPSFKLVDFDGFKNEAGANSFVLSPQKWIESTHAIGIVSKSGRYGGGTFAHKDIAFEFATWISPEFKLYLIKEFQRLKEQESERLTLGWDLKRQLTKINYRIHTDAIKNNLLPATVSQHQAQLTYASEADVLNMALFGKTAKQWREQNKNKEGNIRDYSDVVQLVVLANLEGINAELIKKGVSQPDRLLELNSVAISQIKSLVNTSSIKKLDDLKGVV